jgi:uncharacterized membrane protein
MEKPQTRADYEGTSISRQEYLSAIVHLYRGELDRATVWRMRLDNTTNWSIITTAGLLTFSFDGQHHTHWVLLVGILLITAFLSIEARRFRFFDVWRYRVRKIEENFYGPILRRDPISPDQIWGEKVAEDLLHPIFKISYRAALRARFTRNYWVIYLTLLGGWALKVMLEPIPAHSWGDIRSNLSSGIIPWQVPVGLVVLVLLVMLVTVFFFPRAPLNEDSYWDTTAHVSREVPDIDA